MIPWSQSYPQESSMKTILLLVELMGVVEVLGPTGDKSYPVCRMNSGEASASAIIPRIFVFCVVGLFGVNGMVAQVLLVVAYVAILVRTLSGSLRDERMVFSICVTISSTVASREIVAPGLSGNDPVKLP